MTGSTDHLAAIVQGLDLAVVGCDRNGVVVVWNAAAERLLGLRADGALGGPLAAIWPDDLDDRTIASALDGAGGRVALGPGRVAMDYAPIRDADGAVVGLRLTETVATPDVVRQAEIMRDALDSMNDALSIYDGDDRFVFGNQRFFEMYPFLCERGDIVGHDFEELLRFSLARDPSMSDRERDAYVERRLAARRDHAPIPERQVPDGRWYLVTENRSAKGLTITTRVDISRRKEAELALASTLTVLQAILDTMPNPLIAFDRANHLVAWNRAFEKLVRLTGNELSVGRPLIGVAKDAIRRMPSTEIGIKRMFRAIRGRDSVEFEWQREGSQVFFVTGRPMPDGGYLSMWRDVTAERRAREIARTTQARLVDAIETMSEGFALFDREDRLVLSNARYKELYDVPDEAIDECWTFERFVRYSVASGKFPAAVGREEEWIAERIRQHLDPPETSIIQTLTDGRTYLVSENRTREGGIVGMRADITERVETERELRAARDALAEQTRSLRRLADEIDEARQRAEEADAAKSRFLAMMSHELRTPMTGLLGMIELLSRTALDEEQGGFVDVMRDSAETLLALLNDILDYSKLEAGKIQLEEIPFSPRAVLDDVVRLFQISATSKGLALSGTVDDSVPEWLRGDPLRLKQILSNLVSNGLKFTNEGAVTVSLSATRRDGDAVDLVGSVADTGIGIPDDVQGQLFAAFEQGAANTSRRFGGTGLGLSICKRLVEGMDGWITVDSTLGDGSTFRFSVIMHEAEMPQEDDPEDEPEAEAETPARPIRILLAEDNDVNRMLVSRMLAAAGHRIDEVEDGAAAVEAVRREDYDLVLMDMQMPVMDGAEATTAIRALEGDRARVPVVALTADAVPEHRATYLAAGVDEVLLKPIDWDALTRTIRWASTAGDRRTSTPDEEGPDATLPVFDRARVRSAVGTLPPARAVEMIALVPQEAERQMAEMERGVKAGDLELAKRIAHTLKGLAANFGAARLEHHAALAQADCDDLAKVARRMPGLRAAVDATRDEAPTVIAEYDATPQD